MMTAIDIDNDSDYETANFAGGRLDWIGEPHHDDFGFNVRIDGKVYENDMDIDDYFADCVEYLPDGAVYFDGFIIVHNRADMVRLMNTLQDRYDHINSYRSAKADKGWY